MSWEDTFRSWGVAPGTTEQQKMENAETAIRKAVATHDKLSKLDISIIPQGSYRSRTNVRNDSDVDICVCLNSTFFDRYPAERERAHYGNSDGTVDFDDFRFWVHTALGDHFEYENVDQGNKAFDIHANTYRIDADVLPAFAYRFYHGHGYDDYIQPAGVAFDTADGTKRIINWPHQTYENGKIKQENTGYRYKKMVRIVKRLRNTLQDESAPEAKDIGSFLIESMVWNVPDSSLNHANYTDDVRSVLAYCFNETLEASSHASLYEVNRLKKLFGPHQPWTLTQAHAFFSKAWDRVGFK